MKTRVLQLMMAVTTALALPQTVLAARAVSDLQPPQKRQVTVSTAERLSRPKTPAPLPTELPSPFDPPGFDKPDPADIPVQRAGGDTVRPVQAVLPPTDRETLEKLAAQITPSGMMHLRGSPRLVIGNKPFEIGTRFTATYNNQDYELELVAIERTTFTLRYRSEEITRPIAKTVR